MAVFKVTEAVKEVKWSKKKQRRLAMRSMVPPSPAELNEYDPLLTPQSYNNYGNPSPFGNPEVATSGTEAGAASNPAGGSAPGSSGV